MATPKKMAGTPWHIETLTKKDNDDKRHRSRCIHYSGRETDHCKLRCLQCVGSSHCSHYVDTNSKTAKVVAIENQRKATTNTLGQSKKKKSGRIAFKGVQQLVMQDIQGISKLPLPPIEQVVEVEKEYADNGKFSRPVAVRVAGNHYEIIDGACEYMVARKHGVHLIPAEIGSDRERNAWQALRTIGTKVHIANENEDGTVISFTLENARIQLADGRIIEMNIHKGIETKTLSIL